MEWASRKWWERRRVFWTVLLTVVITWESVSAVPSVGPEWLSFDKLAHFGVFGLLATTIARIEQANRRTLISAVWAAVLVSAYGLGTELLQSLTPLRSMEFGDWLADTLGAAVAAVAYLRWRWYRRQLERPVWRRIRRRPGGTPG
jgi:VanZ family protein